MMKMGITQEGITGYVASPMYGAIGQISGKQEGISTGSLIQGIQKGIKK